MMYDKRCNGQFCPWRQDSHDPDHYVCLQCNQERRIDRTNGWMVLPPALISLLLMVIL